MVVKIGWELRSRYDWGMRSTDVAGCLVAIAANACARPGPAPSRVPSPGSPGSAGSASEVMPTASPTDAGAAPGAAPAAVPPPSPPPATGELTLLAVAPAWGISAAAGKLVVVDDDLVTTSAIDAATGQPVWRTTIEPRPLGWHTLFPAGPHILEWAGEAIHVLDVGAGTELAHHAASNNGGYVGQRRSCYITAAHDTCAWTCECSFTLFECANGAAIGRAHQKQYMEMFPPDEPPQAGCWSGDGEIVGQSGALAILSTSDVDATKPASPGETAVIAVAVDRSTGREAWRVHTGATGPAGASRDGQTCWWFDDKERAQVIDCATGATRWHATVAGEARPRITRFVAPGTRNAPGALYDQAGAVAELRDARTGALRWRATLPAGTLGWIAGTEPGLPYAYEIDATAIAALDATTGKLLASLPRGDHGTVAVDAAGIVVDSAGELASIDGHGAQHHATVAGALERVVLGDTLVAVRTTTDVAVFARADLRELGRVHATVGELLVEGSLGPGRFATHEYDGKVVGRAALWRVGAP